MLSKVRLVTGTRDAAKKWRNRPTPSRSQVSVEVKRLS